MPFTNSHNVLTCPINSITRKDKVNGTMVWEADQLAIQLNIDLIVSIL